MSKKVKFVLQEGHQMKEVKIGGDTFYEFVDSNMAPCHRMFSAMSYYNEMQMRCTREYLQAHCQAIIDAVNGQSEGNKGVIDIARIANLAIQLQERLNWILEPETVYNYASVVFIDPSENPYDYDMKYNKEVKIKRWKQQGVSSFFLSMPVQRLFPPLNLSTHDLEQYLTTLEKLKTVHSKDISIMLSSKSKTSAS